MSLTSFHIFVVSKLVIVNLLFLFKVCVTMNLIDNEFHSHIVEYHGFVRSALSLDATYETGLQRLASGTSIIELANEPTIFGKFMRECVYMMMFNMEEGDGVHIAAFLNTNTHDVAKVAEESSRRCETIFKLAAAAGFVFYENYAGYAKDLVPIDAMVMA